VVTETQEMDLVRGIVLKTFERKQTAVDLEQLDRIFFTFARPSNSFAHLAWYREQPVAASFCVHDREAAYYLLGGYDQRNPHASAGALCVWQAIMRAKEIGLRTFDFEGSMIPSVEKYFRGFGGTLMPYFTLNRAWLLLEMALKFYRRAKF
jgi:hypothetical protein